MDNFVPLCESFTANGKFNGNLLATLKFQYLMQPGFLEHGVHAMAQNGAI